MFHLGSQKPYSDDDDDLDIYGIDDDCQETNILNPNLKINNMQNNFSRDNWFITLHNNSGNKDTFINAAQIVSLSFDEEEYHVEQDDKTFVIGHPTIKFINMVTPAGVYKCQVTKETWLRCASYFRDKNFKDFYVNPILCKNVELKSI